ncbi:MAG: FxsA family protein [Planctomycetaceae bacterium]|jgi:UPF0716 protein FxsA|nr:FxsA family protein [Planctomycetaceae bacterium]
MSFFDLVSISFMNGFLDGWLTYGLTLTIAVGGGLLSWWQWRMIWQRYEKKFAPQNMPNDMILHLVLVVIAAIFFVTPGFLSDLLALLFLFPLTRSVIVFLILQQHVLLQTARMHKQFYEKTRRDHFSDYEEHASNSSRPSNKDDIIDVEFDEK